MISVRGEEQKESNVVVHVGVKAAAFTLNSVIVLAWRWAAESCGSFTLQQGRLVKVSTLEFLFDS